MRSVVPSGLWAGCFFLVLDQFGERLGRAWRETDENDTDYETLTGKSGWSSTAIFPLARLASAPAFRPISINGAGHAAFIPAWNAASIKTVQL
jgi:hypothetical protein